MRGTELENLLLGSRRDAKTELVFFVNAGDPCLSVTLDILRVLAQQRVAAVELCVPFPKSLTDGPMIRASHRRALANGIGFRSVLELVSRSRNELDLAIVLLADYAHTVAPLGLDYFLEACSSTGACATLIHCLPPVLRRQYVEHSAKLGIGRIMSFFAGSDQRTRQAAYREAEGFIYIVARFGRTGQRVSFDAALLERLTAIRAETDKPLAVGFGVTTIDDVIALSSAGADAVIVGSAATAVVQNNIDTPKQIAASFDELVRQLACPLRAHALVWSEDPPAVLL